MSLIVSINEATSLEPDEVEGAAAAQAERNDEPFTISLLLDAAQKERESLDAIEKNMEALRLSLAQRRRVIDQQEEILRDLSQALIERTRKNATR